MSSYSHIIILIFNVWFSPWNLMHESTVNRHCNAIQELSKDVDVIALQEVFTFNAGLVTLSGIHRNVVNCLMDLGFNHMFFDTTSDFLNGNSGLLVATRNHKITERGFERYRNVGGRVQKGIQWVTLEGDIRIINTHMEHQNVEIQEKQIEQLKEFIHESKPQIVVGDLNRYSMDDELIQRLGLHQPDWKKDTTTYPLDGGLYDRFLYNKSIAHVVLYGVQCTSTLSSDHEALKIVFQTKEPFNRQLHYQTDVNECMKTSTQRFQEYYQSMKTREITAIMMVMIPAFILGMKWLLRYYLFLFILFLPMLVDLIYPVTTWFVHLLPL